MGEWVASWCGWLFYPHVRDGGRGPPFVGPGRRGSSRIVQGFRAGCRCLRGSGWKSEVSGFEFWGHGLRLAVWAAVFSLAVLTCVCTCSRLQAFCRVWNTRAPFYQDHPALLARLFWYHKPPGSWSKRFFFEDEHAPPFFPACRGK